MSHFTNMKTRFQNLAYLEKALNRLDILHNRKKGINSKDSYNVNHQHLIYYILLRF